jgi:peptide deformylase
VAIYDIRTFGDPVLRQRAAEITDVDEALVRLAQDMIETMYDAPGVGLAAPQVGVERRMFVYDVGEGPATVLNPRIVESDGEWTYDEGCLSIPGLSWELVRPRRVRLVGVDLDGNEIDIDADELLARCFQHEIDHLDGVLVIERLDEVQRKEAMRVLRQRTLEAPQPRRQLVGKVLSLRGQS